MKYIKTYGINGLLEWHGIVSAGNVKMKVDFTNGSVTAYGVAPASFTTKDALTQHIIENSDMFKGGRIKLVRRVELPLSVAEANEAGQVGKDDTSNEPINAANVSDETAGVQTIKVADKAEAVEWLKSQYPDKGYTSVKLRSKEAFENAQKECNVKFEF